MCVCVSEWRENKFYVDVKILSRRHATEKVTAARLRKLREKKMSMEFTAKCKRQRVNARVTGFAVAQEKGSSKQHEVRFRLRHDFFTSRLQINMSHRSL